MIVNKITVGPLEENCFLISDKETKDAIIIDPGDEPDRIVNLIKKNGLKINVIVCTHAHFDHVSALGDIKKETDAKVLIHKDDAELYEKVKDQAALWGYDINDIPKPDVLLEEGDDIQAGNLTFKVLHTPGHSPGSICLYGEESIFTGDTLFCGSVGRTDFFGGDILQLKESFRRLMGLPEDTKVFSGHGPETTIGQEKQSNFFHKELE
ncbi:MAG: MBL fold metallo-hydrolase [Thermodesulfovibrionia bacterium]|nr:MBL fold metallo-hydrolase [Thermodesulfovibrionia bacterium]